MKGRIPGDPGDIRAQGQSEEGKWRDPKGKSLRFRKREHLGISTKKIQHCGREKKRMERKTEKNSVGGNSEDDMGRDPRHWGVSVETVR